MFKYSKLRATVQTMIGETGVGWQWGITAGGSAGEGGWPTVNSESGRLRESPSRNVFGSASVVCGVAQLRLADDQVALARDDVRNFLGDVNVDAIFLPEHLQQHDVTSQYWPGYVQKLWYCTWRMIFQNKTNKVWACLNSPHSCSWSSLNQISAPFAQPLIRDAVTAATGTNFIKASEQASLVTIYLSNKANKSIMFFPGRRNDGTN